MLFSMRLSAVTPVQDSTPGPSSRSHRNDVYPTPASNTRPQRTVDDDAEEEDDIVEDDDVDDDRRNPAVAFLWTFSTCSKRASPPRHQPSHR